MVDKVEWAHKCPVTGENLFFYAPAIPLYIHKICGQAVNEAKTTDSFGTPILPSKPVIDLKNLPSENQGK